MTHCAGCGATFDLPVLFPADFKGTIAARRRRGQAVEGISLISRELGLGLGTAKATPERSRDRYARAHLRAVA